MNQVGIGQQGNYNMEKIKIPKTIDTSLCPKCIGTVYTFKYGIWFCPECKGTWKKGVFKKSKLELDEFLANQLKKKSK